MNRTIASLILALAGSVTTALAGELDLSGYTAGEVRFFTQRPAFEGQKSDPQVSYVLEPELRYRSEDRADQFSLVPFLRIDSIDDERTHFDLREAYWRHTWDEWEFFVGADIVFWGVTESRHLVNIINQTDGVEDIDEEDKLGQPMVMVGTQRDWGKLDVFLMPYFRERTFPGRKGRLRPPLPVDVDESEYESGAEEYHPDISVRYSHYMGDWDLGAYYFYGTSREPILRLDDRGDRFIPFYSLIHQVGSDIQYTYEAWLWKFEGIVREGQGDPFGATVGGFEYTIYQLSQSAADLGLLLEYNYDGRDVDEAPLAILDNDLFFGSRIALNDVQDTEALLGVTFDVERESTFIFAETERRVGDSWKVEVEARFFANVAGDDPAIAFAQDDFINLSVQRHF